MRSGATLRLLVVVAALVLLGSGVWAMVAPDSFYGVVATYPPYNRHLIHDLGAFLLGLGATLGLALALGDVLLVALTGNAIAGAAHFVSHVVDREIGGQSTDPLTVGLFALFLVALAVWRAASLGRLRA
jgi:hypothetical protein